MSRSDLEPFEPPLPETLPDQRKLMRWLIQAQKNHSSINLLAAQEELGHQEITIALERIDDQSVSMAVVYADDIRYSEALAASTRAVLLMERMGFPTSFIQGVRRYRWKLLLAAQEHAGDFDRYLSPLMIAAREGGVERARVLIEDDDTTELNARAPTGRTPLMYAAARGQIEIMRLLLAKGAQVSMHPPSEFGAVQSALTGGLVALELLLESGAQVDEINRYGETALMYASAWGDTRAAQFLLIRGASPRTPDVEGLTALDWAARNGREDVVAILGSTK